MFFPFFICSLQNSKETQRTNGSSMNSMEQRMRSENKKAEHSRVALHPRSDQEPPSTMQIGVPGKIMQKKGTISLDTVHLQCLAKKHFLLGRFRMYLP